MKQRKRTIDKKLVIERENPQGAIPVVVGFNGQGVHRNLYHRLYDKAVEAIKTGNVPLLILVSMRPKQWIKNCFVFAALVFSQNLFAPRLIFINVMAFVTFCLLSSSIYLLNDILDIEKDRMHPNKRFRPIASGKLSPFIAKIAFTILLVVSLTASFFINIPFALVALGYFVLQCTYCKILKEIVILDVFSIAAGFFLRVTAGAIVINVEMSNWLLVCTMFISLFLALGKRRHELLFLAGNGSEHRKVLNEYNVRLLDQMVSVVTAGTVISYSLYTLSSQTIERFNTRNLWLTIPIVLYGAFRYLYRVYQRDEGGSPEKILLDDKSLLVSIAVYIIVVVTIIYF